MKKYASFVAAVAVAAWVAGCGGGSGVRFSDLFDESAAAEGTGVQGFGLVRAVVILATHDATSRQRQVAEQNGKRAVAQIEARMAAQPEKAAPSISAKPRHTKPVASDPKAKAGSTPGKSAAKAAEAKPPPAKKLPRIIAVATEKDDRTNQKAAKAIMLFDTQSQEIIGNKVYDIEREPRKGDEVRFETYSTSYIGASL